MNTESKPWWESKTIWYAVLTAVGGIIAAFATQFPDIGYIALANSIITVLLRLATTTNISA